MPKYACPICHLPDRFLFWIDPEPPKGCPNDIDEDGNLRWGYGPPQITKLCQRERARAWQQAEFRKLVPDAFDEMGTIKSGRIAEVVVAFGEAHPNTPLVIG